MNHTSILLSISMLISGRDEMEKSLKSLLCFKDAFPTEIILVDTGCNARYRAIAEQYADKIINFEWCNDFAAARNVGLKEAKGEWFLFIDDDEWFDNPQEIISFFVSGEYKEYNCASYVVRNYSNVQGTMYDDSFPSRMVKREQDTHFVGKVHEFIVPYKLPKKTFSDFVHHYGYVYKSVDDREKHAKRNIAPLLEMRKQQPGDPRWMCQLAQEHFSVCEYQKTIDACVESLAEWRALKSYVTYAPSHVGAVYAYLLIALESLGGPEALKKEEEWLKKAFAEPDMKMTIMEPTLAFFCLAGARLYKRLNNYEWSREYFKRYIDYYNKLKNERDLLEVGAAGVVAGVFQEHLLYGMILMCLDAVVLEKDYSLVEEAFYLLDWSDKRLLQQMEFEKNVLKACCSAGYHPLWVKILQTLVDREDGMKEMYVVFLETEMEYKDKEEVEKLVCLHRLVSELDYEHWYILNTRIMWAKESIGEKAVEEGRKEVRSVGGQLFERYLNRFFEIKPEVWNALEVMQISIEELFLKIDYERWYQVVSQWSMSASVQELQQWDKRIATWKQHQDKRYDIFAVKCIEGYLQHIDEVAQTLQDKEKLLWEFADKTLLLHEKMVHEMYLEEISENVQLAQQLKELQKYREQGDNLKALESLRKCLGLYSPLMRAMDVYAKLFRDEMNQENKVAGAEQVELMQLVTSLKKMARMQLEQGDIQAAKNILLQMQQCLPGDDEVIELLKGIDL